jgi:hypothetical protein
MGWQLKSLFSLPIGLRFLLVADAQTAPSFLRFAAIQGIECKESLANLAPKGCFIAAETIEREIWQIGQAQKATRNVDGWITPLGAGLRSQQGGVSGSPVLIKSDGSLSARAEHDCPKIA